MQVVTNENMQEFIQHRKVAEFVPPTAEAPKAEANTEATSIENKNAIDIANDKKLEQARGDDGKFVKAEPAMGEPDKAVKAAGDDEDDADLPERVKRQIGKKHRLMKEAEEFARERDREAAVAEARAADLERRLAALEGPKSGPAQDKKAGDGAPNPEDFKTVAEYADALVEYKMEQKLQKTRKEALEQQQRESFDTAQAEFTKRLQADAKSIPDYEDVVDSTDIIVPPQIAQYIVESDRPAALGYFLIKNPAELERLSKLSPVRAVAELGKLEAQLESKPAKVEAAPKAISRAPSPIAPLEGSKATTVSKDPSQMSFQELRAHRQAERAGGKR